MADDVQSILDGYGFSTAAPPPPVRTGLPPKMSSADATAARTIISGSNFYAQSPETQRAKLRSVPALANVDDTALDDLSNGIKQHIDKIRKAVPTISAMPSPSLWERAKGVVMGDVRSGDTAIGRAAGNAVETVNSPTASTPAPFARFEAAVPEKGIMHGIGEALTGVAAPENVLAIAATGGLGQGAPVLSKMIKLGFSAGQLKQVYDEVPEFQKAVQKGDYTGATQVLAKMGTQTALAATFGKRDAGRIAKASPELSSPGISTTQELPVYKPNFTMPEMEKQALEAVRLANEKAKADLAKQHADVPPVQTGVQPASNFEANARQGFTMPGATQRPPVQAAISGQTARPGFTTASGMTGEYTAPQPAQSQIAAGVAGPGVEVIPSGGAVAPVAGAIEIPKPGGALQPASNFEANEIPPKQITGEVPQPGFTTESGMAGPPASSQADSAVPVQANSASAEPVLRQTDVNAPRPAEGQRTWQPSDPVPPENVPVRMATADIKADPARFQYKGEAVGKGGTTDEFRNVKQWDEGSAGVLQVWKDPADGQVYVTNGHHRLEMANRLGVPDLSVKFIDAPDAQTARIRGAMTNIRDGKGTSLDAAKIFRDGGMQPDDLEREGISTDTKISREGIQLAGLSDRAFGKVVNGDLLPSHGAVIGNVLRGQPESQDSLIDWLKTQKTRYNANEISDIAEQWARFKQADIAATMPDIKPEDLADQQNLFGDFDPDVAQKQLFGEKAQVQEEIRQRLSKDKRLFGLLSKDSAASRLEGTGKNVIDVAGNKSVAQSAGQILEVYQKLVNKAGPMEGIIVDAAKKVAEGLSVTDAAESAYPRIRAEVEGILNPQRFPTGQRAVAEKVAD